MTEQRDFNKDREICNAATEGPWDTARDQAYAFDAANDYLEVWCVTAPKGRLICIDTQDFCGIEDDEAAGPNLQFIAAARKGWPAALDEIEQLKEQIHALEAENHLLREELGR